MSGNKALNSPGIQKGSQLNQPLNHSSGAPPSLTIVFCKLCRVRMASVNVPLSASFTGTYIQQAVPIFVHPPSMTVLRSSTYMHDQHSHGTQLFLFSIESIFSSIDRFIIFHLVVCKQWVVAFAWTNGRTLPKNNWASLNSLSSCGTFSQTVVQKYYAALFSDDGGAK